MGMILRQSPHFLHWLPVALALWALIIYIAA